MTPHIFCPKCGYQRTAADDPSIPQGKCPSCEVYYAKYISQQNAPQPEPRKQKKAEQPKAKVRTHYDNLKVARDASTSAIQAAYDALVEAYHPDKHPDNKDSAEKVMNVIQAAYEELIDPIKRAKHDAWIREQETADIRKEPRHSFKIKDMQKEFSLSRFISANRALVLSNFFESVVALFKRGVLPISVLLLFIPHGVNVWIGLLIVGFASWLLHEMFHFAYEVLTPELNDARKNEQLRKEQQQDAQAEAERLAQAAQAEAQAEALIIKCPYCHKRVTPEPANGSAGCLIPIILLCFFLIPGIIYILWAESRKRCPSCKMIL